MSDLSGCIGRGLRIHMENYAHVQQFQELVCACMCTESLPLYLTLCNPMNCSLPDSSVHGILQERRTTHWSGLPCPPPGDLPHPRIKPEESYSTEELQSTVYRPWQATVYRVAQSDRTKVT